MDKIRVCKDCQERYTAYHDHCDKYKAAKEKLEANKELVLKNKKQDALFGDYNRKKRRSKGSML